MVDIGMSFASRLGHHRGSIIAWVSESPPVRFEYKVSAFGQVADTFFKSIFEE